jgi:hypothetical protein
MHHRMPATVKNWVAQFKRGDFPHVTRLVLKTVITPEIIYQIHELILEDRRPDFG